jgi:hypothetical protein
MNVPQGLDLGPILQAVLGLVAMLIGWVGTKVAARQTADAKKTRAETALLQLAQLVTMLAGKAWDRLSPKVQAALADGRVTPEERAGIEAEVKAILAEGGEQLTSADELGKIASALGLPMAGLIARIAAGIIDMVTRSHDPDLVEDSAAPTAFPVGAELSDEERNALLSAGG